MTPQDRSDLTDARLGIVISGSLSKGIDARLDVGISVEDMAVGRYVTIEGEKRQFFGMITDVTLDVTDPRLMVNPPDLSDPFVVEVLSGTSTYGRIHVLPALTLSGDAASILEGPQPVKTVPSHFSVVRGASEQDVERVFGQVNEKQFYVGTPLDMETKVRLDPAQLVMRSSGVFGKSGTGKTFLTRMILIGILQEGAAVNLIFDMHGEYGWKVSSEEGREVKGLRQLFPSKVEVFTLDEESARRRKVSADYTIQVGYDEVEPEDIAMLGETLGLTDAAVQATYRLARRFGEGKWLESFFAVEGREGLNELAQSIGEHEATLAALRRRLEMLRKLGFLVATTREKAIRRILDCLDRGVSVVLEFGRYDDIVAYILVANLLTRRIHELYRERMERAMGEGGAKPGALVITIEEAHKFLSPAISQQTIFGTIAREMRKYNVTLMVVDQRPSGIDDEVMSQLGTKIICLLDDERDIESVLTGVAAKSELKAVLAKLDSKQQALIFGHAVPMPVVVRTREYGSPQSYRELGFIGATERGAASNDIEKDLWS